MRRPALSGALLEFSMLSRFDPRQRRAILVFGGLWTAALIFVALSALLAGWSP